MRYEIYKGSETIAAFRHKEDAEYFQEWKSTLGGKYSMRQVNELLEYIQKNLATDAAELVTIVEEFLDSVAMIQDVEQILGSEGKDMDYLREELVEWYREYSKIADPFKSNYPEADIEEEIKGLRTWYAKESK